MFEDARQERMYSTLAKSVGQFILSFGEIEALTYVFIGLLCDEPNLGQMVRAEWDFERRRAFVAKFIRKRIVPDDLLTRWADLWRRAKELEQHRNFIAHGSLAMGHDPSAKDGSARFVVISHRSFSTFRPQISKRKDELHEHFAEARSIIKGLTTIWGEVMDCPWRNRLVPEHQFKMGSS